MSENQRLVLSNVVTTGGYDRTLSRMPRWIELDLPLRLLYVQGVPAFAQRSQVSLEGPSQLGWPSGMSESSKQTDFPLL